MQWQRFFLIKPSKVKQFIYTYGFSTRKELPLRIINSVLRLLKNLVFTICDFVHSFFIPLFFFFFVIVIAVDRGVCVFISFIAVLFTYCVFSCFKLNGSSDTTVSTRDPSEQPTKAMRTAVFTVDKNTDTEIFMFMEMIGSSKRICYCGQFPLSQAAFTRHECLVRHSFRYADP